MHSEQRSNLPTDIRPFISARTHPIDTGRYLIGTHEIQNMFSIVDQWIENRAPGGIIYGRPRVGKTRAISFLLIALQERYGVNLPVYVFRCKQEKQPNEQMFFENLLRDVGHAIVESGNKIRKRDRLTNYLLERGESSGVNRVVLFVDDAQRLFEIQYGWLMDIYNELDRYGVALTAILVGQEELLHQRSAFIQAKKAQIVGRFMVHEHKFSGIKNSKELSMCLQGYDDTSEYPPESNWSYTRYFFPEAFTEGFRLTACADDLFQAFHELRREAGLRKLVDIPMQYVTLSVEFCLRHFGVDGENVDRLTKLHWTQAVSKSGYIQSETYNDIV